MEQKKRDRLGVIDYMNTKKNHIVTTRFNNATWSENQHFIRRQDNNNKCVYCAPIMVASAIPSESIMFVMEMNNDTNKIMGIGMIRNHPLVNFASVYTNNNFNRYVYAGKYRIDRTDMTEEEEEVICAFDVVCFRGPRHMKRGHGITAFPNDMLCRCARNKMDLVDYMTNMFKQRKAGNLRSLPCI